MTLNRRTFLQKSSQAALIAAIGGLPLQSIAANNEIHLTVLHTNDWHSRIEPFAMDGGKWQGQGGAAQRATLIKQIRKETPNILLLDSGDIFQGTPYFNYYHGEVEIALMNEMKYDVVTLGNHDFDAGILALAKAAQNANFTYLCANYEVKNTELFNHIFNTKVFDFNGLKIGIMGIGIELQGLVPDALWNGVSVLNPLIIANQTAFHLKREQGCHYVICLSHLGLKYDNSSQPSDVLLAKYTQNIDMILGGHTHTFLDAPIIENNQQNNKVLIHQSGWGGLQLSRIDLIFNHNFHKKSWHAKKV